MSLPSIGIFLEAIFLTGILFKVIYDILDAYLSSRSLRLFLSFLLASLFTTTYDYLFSEEINFYYTLGSLFWAIIAILLIQISLSHSEDTKKLIEDKNLEKQEIYRKNRRTHLPWPIVVILIFWMISLPFNIYGFYEGLVTRWDFDQNYLYLYEDFFQIKVIDGITSGLLVFQGFSIISILLVLWAIFKRKKSFYVIFTAAEIYNVLYVYIQDLFEGMLRDQPYNYMLTIGSLLWAIIFISYVYRSKRVKEIFVN